MAIIQAVNTKLFKKLNVISQCSSVTPYLVVISEYSFTQLIQVFTFKNKPDIFFVRYKLEISLSV